MGRALERRNAKRARALRAGQVEGSIGWEDPKVTDYVSFVFDRFEAAKKALSVANTEWPTEEDHPIWYEFQRQYADWRHWYDLYVSFWHGWVPRDYEEVKTFDVNLSRVLAKAKAAGAVVGSVAPGRHEDPAYKKEQDDEKKKERRADPMSQLVTAVKWTAVAVVVVQVGRAFAR